MVSSVRPLGGTVFQLIDTVSNNPVFSGKLAAGQEVKEWFPGTLYSIADFSLFDKAGYYKGARKQGWKKIMYRPCFVLTTARWRV